MGVRTGEERVQVPMVRALGQRLKKLAVDLQDYIDRDRAMDRGPMLAYVARWFYSLPQGVQATIVAEGKRLTELDEVQGVPDVAEAHGRYLASLHRPAWLRGVVEAIGSETDPASARNVGSLAGDRADDGLGRARPGEVALPGDDQGDRGGWNPVIETSVKSGALPKRDRKRAKPSN